MASAQARAEKAALRYAGKQHRFRAETIVHTKLSYAYNRGADMGVRAAIRQGLMGRCEMVWTTAGTNRVCPRCLALKDTVVGHTDEGGVQIPPLHPRCRCTIAYREVAERNKLEIPTVRDLPQATIKPDNPKVLNSLLTKYVTDEYIVIDAKSPKFMYYEANSGKIFYNPEHENAKFYNIVKSLTHEIAHLIDFEFGISVSLHRKIFEAVKEAQTIIFANRKYYETLLAGILGDNMAVSDLVSAFTDSEIMGAFAHAKDYWQGLGNREREIIAELATIHYLNDKEGLSFIENFPKVKLLFEEVKMHYERSTGITS